MQAHVQVKVWAYVDVLDDGDLHSHWMKLEWGLKWKIDSFLCWLNISLFQAFSLNLSPEKILSRSLLNCFLGTKEIIPWTNISTECENHPILIMNNYDLLRYNQIKAHVKRRGPSDGTISPGILLIPDRPWKDWGPQSEDEGKGPVKGRGRVNRGCPMDHRLWWMIEQFERLCKFI